MNTELIAMIEKLAKETKDPEVAFKLGEIVGYLKKGKDIEYIPYPVYPNSPYTPVYPNTPWWVTTGTSWCGGGSVTTGGITGSGTAGDAYSLTGCGGQIGGSTE